MLTFRVMMRTGTCSQLLQAVALCIALLAAGCAPTRFVKPLVPGTTAVGASLGGPVIKYSGAPIPVPLTSVVVGHGLREDITIFGGLHTTALAFGVYQADAGFIKKLYQQDGWRPAIVVSPVVNMMLDRWERKLSFFPQLDGHFYWHYRQKPHYLYLGISNWIDFNTKRSLGDKQTVHWLPTIQLGHRWITRRWDYVVEARLIAPGQSNRNLVVEYVNPLPQGAFGVYFGWVWKSIKRIKVEFIDDEDDDQDY